MRFRVTVVDDCLMFQCDSTLEHVTYIFGTGEISGNDYGNDDYALFKKIWILTFC